MSARSTHLPSRSTASHSRLSPVVLPVFLLQRREYVQTGADVTGVKFDQLGEMQGAAMGKAGRMAGV